MSDTTASKSARLQKMVHLMYRNPRGLTTRELAAQCGVNKRTVQRDLNDLDATGIPVWDDEEGRHGIDSGYYLPPVHFDLAEAGALYLAARLLARYSDEHSAPIVTALAKLAGVLPEEIAGHIHRTIHSLAYRPENRAFSRVMEVIVLGWGTGRKVRIWYQSTQSHRVREYLFAPYFLEPSTVGYSTYAIGYSDTHGQMQTFKVERIRDAQLTGETFDVPEGFDGAALLQNAWGVMWGEPGREEEMVLRFTPAVTRRVLESVWHPSQRVEKCEGGGCMVRFLLAMPQEAEPWIRSWGPDCEVLAPAWLRDKIAGEMRRAGLVYGPAAECPQEEAGTADSVPGAGEGDGAEGGEG